MRHREYSFVDFESTKERTRIGIHRMFGVYEQKYFEFDRGMTIKEARLIVNKLLFIMKF